MTSVECVECGSNVPIPEDVIANEILNCPDCGVELEVISIEPLTVTLAPEIEEDWGE
jgi:alpha-aminoadipate carrier protein LysW